MLLTLIVSALQSRVREAPAVVRGWEGRSESQLIDALLDGDQGAFAWLVRRHGAGMMRVARGVLDEDAVASEVVQETWETVFKELRNFRRESSLSTWIFRILVNRARRVSRKERRMVPISRLGRADESADTSDEFTRLGRWRSPVHPWTMVDPQTQAISKEGVAILAEKLEKLPDSQKLVVTMRDVEGLDSRTVCELLDISEANQRVLLHRGRTKLRRALEAAEGNPTGRNRRSRREP